MKQKSMFRLFLHYALPAVTGMVVSSLYTVVDGIFVGRGVGEQALAAVNIVYPFIMLQIALSMLAAVGGANLFSAALGGGDKKRANSIFTQALIALAIISVVANAAALIFPGSLCTLLGADAQLLPHSVEYLRWIAIFGFIFMPGLGLSIFVRNDGAPKLEMVGTICGALTNIFLDWLFIMVFGWGLAGAAIATGIGQLVSTAVWFTHLLRHRGVLHFARPTSFRQTGRLLYNGLASFLMEFSQSAITLSFNIVIMARLGAMGVSAYSIVMYICSIFNMVLIGITQGAQPIISYSYGRGDWKRLSGIHRLGIGSGLAATAIFYVIVLLLGRALAGLFLPEGGPVVDLAVQMMRVYFIGFFPVALSLMNILFLQATRREIPSIVISLLRCVGFVLLFLLVLPRPLGTFGIFFAFFCGEACNAIVSVVLGAASERKRAKTSPAGDKKETAVGA